MTEDFDIELAAWHLQADRRSDSVWDLYAQHWQVFDHDETTEWCYEDREYDLEEEWKERSTLIDKYLKGLWNPVFLSFLSGGPLGNVVWVRGKDGSHLLVRNQCSSASIRS